MRAPLIRGYSLSIVYSSRDVQAERYFVELYSQPLHRWVIARVYHWYDMNILKVPGMRRLEQFVQRRHQNDTTYVPWVNKQDIRCALLHRAGRELLLRQQITDEEYKILARATRNTRS
jgi:hypothetical protein